MFWNRVVCNEVVKNGMIGQCRGSLQGLSVLYITCAEGQHAIESAMRRLGRDVQNTWVHEPRQSVGHFQSGVAQPLTLTAAKTSHVAPKT